jgi:hypothetical protein
MRLFVVSCIALIACAGQAEAPPKAPETEEEKKLYAIGLRWLGIPSGTSRASLSPKKW